MKVDEREWGPGGQFHVVVMSTLGSLAKAMLVVSSRGGEERGGKEWEGGGILRVRVKFAMC
jgi:hypothetical protein